MIIKKLKEFMTCDNLSNFKPLRCTIVGQGGTGKTVLLNTVTSVVRRMFQKTGVVRVAAPTGVAACNVGGETLHQLTCRGLKDDYEAGGLSATQLDLLVKRFCDLLCVIIDERSLMSSSLFGTTAQIVSETVFEQCMKHIKESMGGIPFLGLSGDDYQLASMYQGALDCTNRTDGGKMTEKGRQMFKECAETVFQLSTSRRVSDKKQQDRDIMEAVRIGENIPDEYIDKLLSLHLDNIKDKHGIEIVKDIESKAIYLFWTNEKRIEHNIKRLVELNSEDNPTSIIHCKSSSSKFAKAANSHFDGDFPGTSLLCDGAMVALQGRNFCPVWGLHNGACGIVKERVFAKGKNPNNRDFPSYVVVDFPLYDGPVWDINNPKVSSMKLIFLTLYFSLTIFLVRSNSCCYCRLQIPLLPTNLCPIGLSICKNSSQISRS